MDIQEFLLARIAEDEAAANEAKDATGAEWVAHGSLLMYVDDPESRLAEPVGAVEDYRMDPAWKHVERHDPTRALRECAAKRAIVEHCQTLSKKVFNDNLWNIDEHEDILESLASAYSDHPDYQQKWSF